MYSEDHEWVRLEAETAYIGFTLPFVEKLTEVVKLDLPEVGEELIQTIEFGFVEGHRNLKEIYAPLSGKILAINEELLENKRLLLDDPYGDGWLLQMKIYDEEETGLLLNANQYKQYLADNDFEAFGRGEE